MVRLRPVLLFGFQGRGAERTFVTIMFVVEDPVLDELKKRCEEELHSTGDEGWSCSEYRRRLRMIEDDIREAIATRTVVELKGENRRRSASESNMHD